ncbi:MAG: TIGR01777 family oxidoreductase [Proteobacteria bacterium]|nr:TIGR01777 family oxidoreductase [Pseudomonadota bacterium]
MKERIFTKKTYINVPVGQLFAWHARNGAILRLTPPWAPLKLISRIGSGIDKGVKVRFRMRLFKIPMIWEAEHIDYQENILFQDHQTRGPFGKWVHTHLFHAQGENGSVMEDRVCFKLPFGFLSLPFYSHAEKQLARVFDYRHRVLKQDLERRADKVRKQRILISGASGTIGSSLVPFLRTCGHEVIRLVRNPSDLAEDTLFWDPYKNILDMEKAGPIDAVINLNGVDISRGKWTDVQKKQILDSRVCPTLFLAKKISQMAQPPDVFISSSAIGLYGDRKDQVLTEKDTKGDSFISHVCEQWEQASLKAMDAGIRTVQLRIGVVLTPAGGALARMVLPFSLGLGTRLSHGNQYMSWISMDDALGGILHILENRNLEGPVNLTAPHPVTNRDFTRTLGRVFGRPAFFVIPRRVALALWGDMGKETLLASARVVPEKLEKNGFVFEHYALTPALKDMLGK